jgi:hypothetical protein
MRPGSLAGSILKLTLPTWGFIAKMSGFVFKMSGVDLVTFSRSVDALIDLRRLVRSQAGNLNSPGVIPMYRLNAVVNWLWS